MKKEYSEEFRKGSVRLYESGDASMAEVACELGVNHHTFYNWVEKYGTKSDVPGFAMT